MNENKPGAIFAKMHSIMAKVGSIGKNNTNTFQNFKYRSITQVLEALQPLLVEHGVVVQPSFAHPQILEQDKGFGVCLQLALTFWSIDDGSCYTVHAVGASVDSSDKAGNKAMTAALKYALTSTFAIPDSSDGDADSPDVKIKAKPVGGKTREIF